MLSNLTNTLWCNSEIVATECSVLDACLYYNTSQLDKKIKLTLLYETLCPDCQEFILNTLQRYVWKYGQDFVDFNFIPYGNARRTQLNNTWTIQCQHGPVECALNKLHGCAISKLVYVGKWFPLINAASGSIFNLAASSKQTINGNHFPTYTSLLIAQP
ncbi:GILT-like protein F37H8.5 [Trichinella sp. T6]|nr:GILT-like protein F37H8.5 [Trichinella sp. T6]